MATDWNEKLMDAVFDGDVKLLQEAIANGADVNWRDKDKQTALIMASFWGRTEITLALIAAGADVTLQNDKGHTALRFASRNRRTEIVPMLEKAARTDRRWREAEEIREKLRAGNTDPSEVGF